jgi:hypothetical protein
MERVLSRIFRFHADERGQAMLETAIVVPALLALFLGLWQHVLLELAQTRAFLAARHVAWASSYLHESDANAQKRAKAFFPDGAEISATCKGITTKNEAANLAAQVALVFADPEKGKDWSEATVQATVPVLPYAAPLPPGGGQDRWAVPDFLGSVKTHAETCYALNRCAGTRAYFIKSVVLPVFRLDLVAAKMIPRLFRIYIVKGLKSAMFGDKDDDTKAILGVIFDVVLDGVEKLINWIFS